MFGIKAATNIISANKSDCAREDNPKVIAAEIMSYLNRRPLASDSLDGIARWCFVQQKIVNRIDLVEANTRKIN